MCVHMDRKGNGKICNLMFYVLVSRIFYFYFLFLSFYTFSVTNMFDNKEKKSSIFLIEYT